MSSFCENVMYRSHGYLMGMKTVVMMNLSLCHNIDGGTVWLLLPMSGLF